MRSLCLISLVLLFSGCGSGGGVSIASSHERSFSFTAQPEIVAEAGSDPTLEPIAQAAMVGRVFDLGYHRTFEADAFSNSKLESGSADSFRTGDSGNPVGTLSLQGRQAVYSELIPSDNPDLTNLALHGTFDATPMNDAVATLWQLPYDETTTTASGLADVNVHWQIGGEFRGVPFTFGFDESLRLTKRDYFAF